MVSREQLSQIKSFDSFFSLCQSLVENKDSVFESLFRIAINNTGDGAHLMAGLALIAIEPESNSSCDSLLKQIACSTWDLSDKSIPFYLAAQFGKFQVREAISELIASNELGKDQLILIEGIKYWLSMPLASLSEPLNYFEWQEVIESGNS